MNCSTRFATSCKSLRSSAANVPVGIPEGADQLIGRQLIEYPPTKHIEDLASSSN